MDILIEDKKYITKKIQKIIALRSLFSLIFKVVAFLLVLYLTFTYVFGFVISSGLSMYPRVSDSDLLLYYRLDEKYKTGDILVFENDGKEYISRVVGTGGQTIDIDKDGNLIVDNHVVDEKIVYRTYKDKTSSISFPYTIPDGQYFVLGDFRMNSTDSRNFGAIDKSQIKGSVINLLRSRDL